MARIKNIEELDPLMDVALMPIERAGRRLSEQSVVLDPSRINQDIAIVGPDYRLVTNRTARDVALDVLERSGQRYEEKTCAFSGKAYRQRWIFPDITIEPRVGDFVALGIDVVNSYDKSTPFGLWYIAYRLQCLNGMVLDFKLGGFRFRHYDGNGNRDWQRELDNAVAEISGMSKNIDMILPALRNMLDTVYTLPTFIRDILSIDPKASMVGDVLKNLSAETKTETAWDLYNAFTRTLSVKDTISNDNKNRRVSQYFFDRYGNGASKGE